MQVENHLFWVAKSAALKGCVGQGETAQDAITELESNETEWLITANECGIPIPAPSIQKENSYSGKVSLRFSAFTHQEASENAKSLGVSLNQYISDAIVYYNATVKNNHLEKSVITDFGQYTTPEEQAARIEKCSILSPINITFSDRAVETKNNQQ